MPDRSVTPLATVRRVESGRITAVPDLVATEEPMELRVVLLGEEPPQTHMVSVTMRTPGFDFELAAGFLLAEGVIAGRDDVYDVSYCADADAEQEYNVVSVTVAPERARSVDAEALGRRFTTTSSCGVCGRASLEGLRLRGLPAPDADRPLIDASLIPRLPGLLREGQVLFEQTGGLHAAGLFDVAGGDATGGDATGGLVAVREDVGRHNAVDKLVGHHLLAGDLPLRDSLLMLSGRVSWELMQKAVAAGIPMVAAVGAPSSLAVDVATEFGMTLVGFVRGNGFNIYAGAGRILTRASSERQYGGIQAQAARRCRLSSDY